MGLPSLCPWARVSDPGGGHLEKLPLWALRSLSCEGLHPQVPPSCKVRRAHCLPLLGGPAVPPSSDGALMAAFTCHRGLSVCTPGRGPGRCSCPRPPPVHWSRPWDWLRTESTNQSPGAGHSRRPPGLSPGPGGTPGRPPPLTGCPVSSLLARAPPVRRWPMTAARRPRAAGEEPVTDMAVPSPGRPSHALLCHAPRAPPEARFLAWVASHRMPYEPVGLETINGPGGG